MNGKIYLLTVVYSLDCVHTMIFNNEYDRLNAKIEWLRTECDDLYDWFENVGLNIEDVSEAVLLEEWDRMDFNLKSSNIIESEHELSLNSEISIKNIKITYKDKVYDYNPYESINVNEGNVAIDLPTLDAPIIIKFDTLAKLIKENNFEYLSSDQKEFWQEFLPVALKVANDKINTYHELGFDKW